MTSDVVLSERAQYLLKVLIEQYVLDGKPVGSRTLARSSRLVISPATIRNVMSDLEDLGMIMSPHTSAGRVPTDKGYRFFVDCLLTLKPLNSQEVNEIRAELSPDSDTRQLLSSATDKLSEITRLAGVVMLPRSEYRALRQVEFLPLSDNRVLVILVINDQEVQNRVIVTQRKYTPAELQQAANYLNQAFSGLNIQGVRERLVREMQEVRDDMDRMMQAAIEMASQVFTDETDEDDCIIAGETNLMNFAELSDVVILRELFEAFNQKRDILHLLDQSMSAQGVQIWIGDEAGYKTFDGCSMVTSSYDVDGQVAGVVGVIGPTRMAYQRIIPIVDMTAKLLGAALKPRH